MSGNTTFSTPILVPYIFTERGWAGGAIYISNLVRALSALPKTEQPCLLLMHPVSGPIPNELRELAEHSAVGGIFSAKLSPLALKPWLFNELIDPKTGAVKEDRRRALFARIEVSFPVPYSMWDVRGLPNPIYWIPDFQHKHLPALFPADEIAFREQKFGDIANSPVPLILSSEAALKDLHRFYPNHRCRPFVWSFCSAITREDVAASADPIARFSLPRRFFYIANQFWAHKDHLTAFRAIELLRSRGYDANLVCTGSENDHRNPSYFHELKAYVHDRELSDHIRFLGLVPRREQIGIFRHALAVIQPSRFEGWSTVVEDARALGRPLILSDIDVHREQMGCDANFFRTGNAEDLAQILSAAWSQPQTAPNLEREQAALTAGQERQIACGRGFLDIVRKRRQPMTQQTVKKSALTSRHAISSCYTPQIEQHEWYPPVMIGADHFATVLFDGNYVEQALELLGRLDPDSYTRYLESFYNDGLKRFGKQWRYADIVTVLLCLSDLLRPVNYLEIGVRRGRTLSAVGSRSQDCSIFAFDMWVQGYAGMDNPGPTFVSGQLAKIGHRGTVQFVDGNSRTTLPKFFAENERIGFDLITVDGDHSPEGASSDIGDVLPHLAIGGAIVFDDICHPAHPELGRIWHQVIVENPRYSSWSYTDTGYGVGVAIRKY